LSIRLKTALIDLDFRAGELSSPDRGGIGVAGLPILAVAIASRLPYSASLRSSRFACRLRPCAELLVAIVLR